MPQLPKDFKNRKTLLIGTAAVLLVTALTFWNWKSTHKKDPSVKQKKSHTREAVKKEDKKKDVKQPKADESNIKETAVKEETKTLSVEEQQVNAIEQAIEEVVEELIAEEAVAIETVAIESVAKEPAAEEPATMETNDNETTTNEPIAEASTTENQVPEEEKITDEAVIMEEQVTVEAVVEEKEKSVEISEEVVVIAAVSSHFDESSSTKSQPISTATSSTDETDIRTPEQDTQLKESVFDWTESSVVKDDDFVVVKRTVDSDVEADMPQFNTLAPSSTLTASAPEFVPKAYQTQPKKSNKKYMTREQLIEQQRQHHIPRSKARCSHWPHCTNNNCKFFHPYKPCRAGDECVFGERCMFVHPSDCIVPTREKSPSSSILLN